MGQSLIDEEELTVRLAALVDRIAVVDRPPTEALHRGRRGWTRTTVALAGVAAAVLAFVVVLGAIGTDTAVMTAPRADLPVRPPLVAIPPSTYPDGAIEGAGSRVEPGGLLVTKTSQDGSADLQASGIAVQGGSFDLWTAGSDAVVIDDVSTASETGLEFQLELAGWPEQIDPGTAFDVPYDLICDGWQCGGGERAVTLRIRGHVNGSPEVDAFVITFGALLRPPTATACPDARQMFERPRRADEIGDGLPPAGASTMQAAEAAEPLARQDYGAIDSEIVEVAGRAWVRGASGQVEIVPEQLFVVRLTMASESSCPDAPAFRTVPLMFQYPTAK